MLRCVESHPMRSEQILNLAQRIGGTVSAAELIGGGARWEDVYRLRDDGTLEGS
jgi:hypothetical protein